jgi:hypothetical protein
MNNNSPEHYERIGILKLHDVFPHIKENFNNFGKRKVNINGFNVNVQSLRLRTFYKQGVTCPCCSLTAQYFAVERSKGNSGGYHLNLYGLNNQNEEVIFTHDHIIARALGGADDITNSITMCGPCNWNKGKIEQLLTKTEDPIEIEKLQKELEKLKFHI